MKENSATGAASLSRGFHPRHQVPSSLSLFAEELDVTQRFICDGRSAFQR
jgi:hypothetical protein